MRFVIYQTHVVTFIGGILPERLGWWTLTFCCLTKHSQLARACAAFTRSERSFLALLRADFLEALKVLPARLIKNVSMRIPEPGPLGETFFDARVRAIVSGSLLNNPSGGCVESVLTLPDHLFAVCAITTSVKWLVSFEVLHLALVLPRSLQR
jgi:hypothetical protein